MAVVIFATYACLGGDIGETLSGVVAEKVVLPPVDDVQVRPAVVVIVGKSGTAAVAVGQGNARGEGGTAEGAIAVVAEEAVGSFGVGDVEVYPAILVVVAPCLANGAVVALARLGNACGTADVLEEGGG